MCVPGLISFNVNAEKNSILFGKPHLGNSSFLFLEMPETSSMRHDLGLSQLLRSPGLCPGLVSPFFEIEPHPTHSLGAHSSLEDRERKPVWSGTSSNRRKELCNKLTKFSFCLSRQLSPVPGCTLFWGWLGMKHYLYEKNKSEAYAPDGEIPAHSVGGHGKWVPGCTQATGLRGNSPHARTLHGSSLRTDVWE